MFEKIKKLKYIDWIDWGKRLFLYCCRWQLSTPILAICIALLPYSITVKTIIANFIGALMFFFPDRFIFKEVLKFPEWEVKNNIKCYDCGKIARGYRLVRALNYDKRNSEKKYRCETCSIIKEDQLRECGIKI